MLTHNQHRDSIDDIIAKVRRELIENIKNTIIPEVAVRSGLMINGKSLDYDAEWYDGFNKCRKEVIDNLNRIV